VKEGPGVSCNNFLKGNRTGSSFSLVVLCEKDITKGKKKMMAHFSHSNNYK